MVLKVFKIFYLIIYLFVNSDICNTRAQSYPAVLENKAYYFLSSHSKKLSKTGDGREVSHHRIIFSAKKLVKILRFW